MNFFINKGIYQRQWHETTKITHLPDSKLQLEIPNYIESKRKHETIKFIFSNIEKIDLEDDVLLNGVSINEADKNTYNIESSKNEDNMYALLRCRNRVPDDVFIPSSMKNKVKVLRRIRFVDVEADYGDFLSNVYLIQINLNPGESIPVYLSYNKPGVLDIHYVFSKPEWIGDYIVSDELKTYILISNNNKDEYISLSHLCSK